MNLSQTWVRLSYSSLRCTAAQSCINRISFLVHIFSVHNVLIHIHCIIFCCLSPVSNLQMQNNTKTFFMKQLSAFAILHSSTAFAARFCSDARSIYVKWKLLHCQPGSWLATIMGCCTNLFRPTVWPCCKQEFLWTIATPQEAQHCLWLLRDHALLLSIYCCGMVLTQTCESRLYYW